VSAPPTVLITGAAQRIGRALALDFAARGWRVGIHCRASRREADGLAADIRARGGSAAVLAADLADPGAVAGLLPQCVTALGPPTCLVNNAAMFAYDEAATLDAAAWDAQLAVNLRAPVFLTKAFAEHLPPDMTGNVINMIDQRVWKPTPRFFSYGVAKAGLWSATRMLAQALGPRIRVNAIGPGPVLRNAYQSEEEFRQQCEATILRRATSVAEIAAAVHFILDAPALTGQMIALDGGQHLTWESADAGHTRG
jgi:NAD(P)-dependent dehydrogenase (short-subunit alcohol dehydrogenase family)